MTDTKRETEMTATQLAAKCNELLDICSVNVETKAQEVFPLEYALCELYRMGLVQPKMRSQIRLENFMKWIEVRVG